LKSGQVDPKSMRVLATSMHFPKQVNFTFMSLTNGKYE
jgi:hypothetical protein